MPRSELAIVAVGVIISVIRSVMLAPLVLAPFTMSLPAAVLPILAARTAPPIRLLNRGFLADGWRRDRSCGRGANRSQANKAGCGREGNQGLAHGSDLPGSCNDPNGGCGWRRIGGGIAAELWWHLTCS